MTRLDRDPLRLIRLAKTARYEPACILSAGSFVARRFPLKLLSSKLNPDYDFSALNCEKYRT